MKLNFSSTNIVTNVVTPDVTTHHHHQEDDHMDFMQTKYVFLILFALTVLMLFAAQLLSHGGA